MKKVRRTGAAVQVEERGMAMDRHEIRLLKRTAPAFLGLIALALVLWTPGSGFAAGDDASAEGAMRWYDPSDWFTKGESLPHESQWYDQTYGDSAAKSIPAHQAPVGHSYFPQTEEVMPPEEGRMERYEGQILDVRTAWVRGAPLQVFARVRLDSGAVTAVDLGPRNQLSYIDLGELKGKEIALLAHSATIAGEKALVAHRIKLFGRTFRIDWSPPRG